MVREFGINTTWDDVKNMTIDEAISVLSKYTVSDGEDWSARPHMVMACRMAVKALEKERDRKEHCMKNIYKEPIPTYGMDNKRFRLTLSYRNYYGHNVSKQDEMVIGIWDSLNECFFEEKTYKEIDRQDIISWDFAGDK